MTCRYEKTDWRDVLYTSVRNTVGGVADAAQFLQNRRGRTMHKETLRAKLRGLEGESVSVEIADLLTEWMEEKNREDATDWIKALASGHGLVSVEVDGADDEAEPETEIFGLCTKSMELTALWGKLSALLIDAIKDEVISATASDQIVAQIDEEMRALSNLRRNVLATSRLGQPALA